MRFSVSTEATTTLSASLVSVLVFDDAPTESPTFAALNDALGGALTKLATDEQWKGKKGQTISLPTLGKLPADRLLIVGGGARKDFVVADLRALAARTAKHAGVVGAKRVAIAVPVLDGGSLERGIQFLVEGAKLATYRYDKYLAEDKRKPSPIDELSFVVDAATVEGGRLDSLQRSIQRAEKVVAGVTLARDLVNAPPSDMTPSDMAAVAERVAKQHGLECTIYGKKECEKLGMGMFLGVARGAEAEPKLIHLVYKPLGKAAKRKVALVGKGVTFDSGGLSLKPSNAMEDMKTDMAGAAAVISAIGVLADLGCPVEVHAVAACTENMLSATAYKLGDVLRAKNGKTVEINNTDAEGRLTLGDAFSFILEAAKPDELIDLATLTGAVIVALGPHIAGVMGNDLSLIEKILSSAKLAGEEAWHLPLPERLRDQLKSDIADMRNTGDRMGGALTAGIFLKEFVGDTPWVHIDIAGPSSADKEHGHILAGGTGFGVATLVEYLVPRL